jgi:hypothetical protein
VSFLIIEEGLDMGMSEANARVSLIPFFSGVEDEKFLEATSPGFTGLGTAAITEFLTETEQEVFAQSWRKQTERAANPGVASEGAPFEIVDVVRVHEVAVREIDTLIPKASLDKVIAHDHTAFAKKFIEVEIVIALDPHDGKARVGPSLDFREKLEVAFDPEIEGSHHKIENVPEKPKFRYAACAQVL